MIEGVKIKKLNILKDDRGRLMEILRMDDDIFEGFGQVYMTTALPGAVKAWHYHKEQTDNFTCIKGKMLLGLYDAREGSSTFGETMRFEISLEDPMVVQIPNDVFHGFKCMKNLSLIIGSFFISLTISMSVIPNLLAITDTFCGVKLSLPRYMSLKLLHVA